MALFNRNPKPKAKAPDPAPAAPAFDPTQFVSKESIGEIVKQAVAEATSQDKQTIAELRGQVETIRSSQPTTQPVIPTTPVAPAIPDISDDEIDTIVASGEKGAAAKIRQLIKRNVEDHVKGLESRINQAESFAVQNMATMARKAAMDEMPHFKRFQKEIEATIKTLQPEAAARTDVWKYVHDQIVGANFETLETERAEERARAEAAQAEASATPGSGKGAATGDERHIPTPEELGREQKMALEASGKSPDEFAKRLGYENWDNYMEQAAESGFDLTDVVGTA